MQGNRYNFGLPFPIRQDRRRIIRDVKNPPKRKGVKGMTVCIAAICEKRAKVVCAADTILSTDDGQISFESATSKLKLITESIGILISGEMTLNSQIVSEVSRIVEDLKKEKPGEKWTVENIADLYADCFTGIRIKKAQTAILSPLGLTLEEFRKNPDANLKKKIEQYKMSEVEAIIAGVDETGARIFLARNYSEKSNGTFIDVGDFTPQGYIAIGIGRNHAESEFMFQKYTIESSFEDAMILTYIAKRRAETALGVGLQTELFLFRYGGLDAVTFSKVFFDDKLKAILSDAYERLKAVEASAIVEAKKTFFEGISALIDSYGAISQIEEIKENKETIKKTFEETE